MKKDSCCNTGSMCPKCRGYSKLTLAALVLLNTYFTVLSWPIFIGVILAVAGVKQILSPGCPCK